MLDPRTLLLGEAAVCQRGEVQGTQPGRPGDRGRENQCSPATLDGGVEWRKGTWVLVLGGGTGACPLARITHSLGLSFLI